MTEIEFSIMEGNRGDVDNLQPLMEAFEKQSHVHVDLVGITWAQGWAEVAKFGIFGHGPDISSIGTTWVGSLASMQALHPFSPQEICALGGPQAFFDATWKSGLLPNDPTPWAVPWLSDVMVFYYWKDAFEKAGIQNINTAFSSDDALVGTLEKLRESGYAYPLALTTVHNSVIIHEAAHWIWSAGGDFISPDNQQVIFNQPAAMKGWKSYFGLQPFISPASLRVVSSGDLFNGRADGDAAVNLGGPWKGVIGRRMHPEWGKWLGIAPVPGLSFVGGSSLVIWQYTRHSQEAFDLIRFLCSQPARIPASPHDHELPTRSDAVHMLSAQHDPFDNTYLHALQNGRSFPTIRLWGSVEDKVITEITKIWAELFDDPHQDLDACLHRHFDPLAQRLNMVMKN